MKIQTIEISGLYPAMAAIHLPMGKPAAAQRFNHDNEIKEYDNCFSINTSYRDEIPKSDIALASRLVLSGDEHAKVLRGIVVYAQITAPIYLWNEFVTYRIGSECLSSTSTMHSECKGLTGEALQQAKAAIPMGHEQTRILMLSYQTLRRIYFQRRHHRLPEWHDICHWIEQLPFASSLITAERKPAPVDWLVSLDSFVRASIDSIVSFVSVEKPKNKNNFTKIFQPENSCKIFSIFAAVFRQYSTSKTSAYEQTTKNDAAQSPRLARTTAQPDRQARGVAYPPRGATQRGIMYGR